MTEQTAIELELAKLIIESLNLEDMDPSEIDPQEPLFGDGLGLDSIDALEIALAISQRYNVQMQAEDEGVHKAFSTLASLSSFVEQQKAN